ncbi:MAG: hypothetical protein ACI4QI_01915 [Candidatus Coproplasma sp.]
MNISKELIQKAKTAKTAEELFELARAEGVELSQEEAAKHFAELNKTGELSDDELNNVAGGCGEPDPPKYAVGDKVWFYTRYEVGLFRYNKNSSIGVIKEVMADMEDGKHKYYIKIPDYEVYYTVDEDKVIGYV